MTSLGAARALFHSYQYVSVFELIQNAGGYDDYQVTTPAGPQDAGILRLWDLFNNIHSWTYIIY